MAPHPAPLSADAPTFIRCDEDIGALVARFVEAERTASAAYNDAFWLDWPAERLKDRLIAFVEEFGIADAGGSQRTLRVRDFLVKVTSARSSRVDPISVRDLRYALIRDGRGRHGIAAEIFNAQMIYSFAPGSRELLARMRLSGHLRELLEKCEVVSEVPILDVSRIASE